MTRAVVRDRSRRRRRDPSIQAPLRAVLRVKRKRSPRYATNQNQQLLRRGTAFDTHVIVADRLRPLPIAFVEVLGPLEKRRPGELDARDEPTLLVVGTEEPAVVREREAEPTDSSCM